MYFSHIYVCDKLINDELCSHQFSCARAEVIIPAPEATHGIATTIAEANKCKKEGISKTILFNLCGYGNFDMEAYDDFFAGKIVRYGLPSEAIETSLAELDIPEIN